MPEGGTESAIHRKAVLCLCRRNLNMKGLLRFWELGPVKYYPQWYNTTRPNIFCDAEFFYRHHQRSPAPGLRLKSPIKHEGYMRELVVLFDRVSLYKATFQLRIAEMDGQLVKIIEG